jgi:hypothetical protein
VLDLFIVTESAAVLKGFIAPSGISSAQDNAGSH